MCSLKGRLTLRGFDFLDNLSLLLDFTVTWECDSLSHFFLGTEVTLDSKRLHLLSDYALLIDKLLLLGMTWLAWTQKWGGFRSQTNWLGDHIDIFGAKFSLLCF